MFYSLLFSSKKCFINCFYFRLKDKGVPVRFCSNTTTQTKSHLVNELKRLGFSADESEVFTPAPAAARMIKQKNLRPHLLVHPGGLNYHISSGVMSFII